MFSPVSRIRKAPPEFETDFTDRGYQNKLPMHARSTATQSVKNNLRITEIQADSSLILNAQKVSQIILHFIEEINSDQHIILYNYIMFISSFPIKFRILIT